MSGHQRTRSGSGNLGPSKLSQITLAPLSPTPESGDATTPTSAGFFSSMFSAAQSAASTISSNIQGSTGIGAANKTKAASFQHQGPPQLNLVDFDSPGPGLQFEISMDKESAIQTIGSGDLSLSQLGIPENAPPMASPEASKFPDLLDTRFRSESAPSSDNQMISPILPPEEAAIRPRSLYETAEQDRIGSQADLADPRSSEMQRSPSAKSDAKSVRARGSSVTAANLPSAASMTAGDGAAAAAPSPALSSAAIPPAVSSATSSLAPPTGASAAGQPGAPKLTGFAIASKKRNRDFHGLFKSVPDDDYLIEDYSCALQREILAHGRLYVSEGHLCFSSNILGWVTTLVMSFDEIVSVEKRSTALVFKNGLMISTLHAKHIFASFTSRDATYDLIVNIWKLGHPTLKSTLNGVRLEGTGGDKTEKIDAEPAAAENETQPISDSDENVAEDEEEDDFYDEEDEGEQAVESQTSNANSVDGGERVRSRKVSGATIADGAQPALGKPDASADGDAGSFPGPATHAPTDCGDAASHYERVIGDEVIPAPLGKVYSLMFGPQSPTWMANWISGEQKCLELQMEDKKGLSLDNRSRDLSYIKPLYASIGPKQTKCMVTETLDSFDLDKAVSVNVRTQNPDVPNGNIFCVKTKYCLSWAENNATRVHVNCVTEWSGKSWLKGPIEKNVNEGQATYCKDLFTALKAAVSSRPRSATLPNGTPKKGKKGKKGKVQPSAADSAEERAKPKVPVRESWGLLEPIHDVAEPVVDILKPLFAGNLMYGLIVGLLAAILFRSLSSPTRDAPAPGLSDAGLYNPHRQMLYDEMWRREESELWDWLEERVGLERLAAEGSNARRRVAEPRLLADKLREERMDRRGVEEAIRVTEEKLQLLRDVVAKSGGQQRGRQ
ncbi:putative membrane protein [Escovopsis weberi]|uniref:Putative membrane protein n=1 Tax=Escovopsis weberi TaxID=150374 RepID=A0A0M9VSG6_ESCWE|nr:putative membrane protein [Escovopsis weberi]